MLTFETKIHRLDDLPRWSSSAWPQCSKIWGSDSGRDGMARAMGPWSSVEAGQKYPKIKGETWNSILLTFGQLVPAWAINSETLGREFVVDSGASMHMISKKDLSEAEMDTLTKSCSPTIVITANGEVQTHEEATVYVKELDIFLTMKVLEDTPPALSLGNLCDEHGYSCEWIKCQKTRKTSYRSWFLVYQRVLPQLALFNIHDTFKAGSWSTSSSSSSTTPNMTSSTVSSDSVTRQARGTCEG